MTDRYTPGKQVRIDEGRKPLCRILEVRRDGDKVTGLRVKAIDDGREILVHPRLCK